MNKKLLSIILILNLLFLTSCSHKNEYITRFSSEPWDISIEDAEATKTIEILVYHDGYFVNKIVEIEKLILKSGAKEHLDFVKYMTDITFNQDPFKVNGFNYSYEISDTTFTLTSIYDYTKMDIKKIIENGNELVSEDFINNNYQIVYDKLKESYAILGLTCEEYK